MSIHKKRLFLAVLSGILLIIAWPADGIAAFLFVGFVPLLLLENHFVTTNGNPGRFFGLNYISFLVWNIGTTWWVYNASLGGAIMAFGFNSLFMAVVFQLFFITHKRLGSIAGYLSLIAYWIGFEYIHLQWELSWPWLTLGNGFAASWKWIQWYEYTGAFGGTLWTWLINFLVFGICLLFVDKNLKFNIRNIDASEKQKRNKKFKLYWRILIVLLIFPILISYRIYSDYKEDQRPVEVVVVQPNIDPYNEKFSGLSPEDQLAKMLRLAMLAVDSNTDYVVVPETALPVELNEKGLLYTNEVQTIKKILKNYPTLTFIGGLASFKEYQKGEAVSSTARKFTQGEGYYDSFNTGMQVDNTDSIQLYHKSKLVPGVERMPLPSILKYLDKFAVNLGGMVGSLGTQEERSVFISSAGIKVAPVICYESVYGEYVTGYIKNKADLIFIITNDGWWGDTPGYHQHVNYARLRAIETRRSIARSANTGVSCFVDQRGDISQPTKWWEPTVIKEKINANSKITFYVEYGDYIAKFFSIIAIGLLLINFALFIKGKFKRKL